MDFLTHSGRFIAATALLVLIEVGPALCSDISGAVLDPQGQPIAAATVDVRSPSQGAFNCKTDHAGEFTFRGVSDTDYEITAKAPGFAPVTQWVHVSGSEPSRIRLQLTQITRRAESVSVTADVNQIDVESPDPAEKVFAREDLLDANPGRPGAPISIPGYPIETASSGIKAPQYFAPGVAGDHGEPIAQFLQVGSYLVPNNLSANAHGNGYADPNIYIADVIESVQVDGGAFNVREGNHALNLATTYGLRSRLEPFVSLTGDQHDLSGTAGANFSQHGWMATEGSFGNGYLDRPEHRKQIKLNAGDVFHLGRNTLTVFGIGYYGFSYVAGLSPIHGFNSVDAANGWQQYPDTIDPRQKDQTHTSLAAVNDVWDLGDGQQLQLSAFFRTYNLSLYSDFGDGLIRQSEFRTVTGGSAAYKKQFFRGFTFLAGTDYEREAPRRDNLDHYGFFDEANPAYYGPFLAVDSNNVTISPLSPYVAGEGSLSRYFRYYLGWRRDEILVSDQDLLNPANSRNRLVGLNSPKATLTFLPKQSWWAPQVAFSFGKSFFTEDPRTSSLAGSVGAADPVETARSYQLVLSKELRSTDLKLTFGHETQSAEYGKIDPDTGLRFDLGPGRINYLAVTLRQSFRFGSLQATYEQADARDLVSGQVTPEAPRLIGDFSWTYDRLPFQLRAKGEFEYVAQKVLGTGCNEAATDLSSYCIGVPNREFRLSLARSFREDRFSVGLNMMIATGYTGQTTEAFATNYKPGDVSPLPVPENAVSEVVGVRLPSYASVSVRYRFGRI